MAIMLKDMNEDILNPLNYASEFALDILTGLSLQPKKLSSKYLYDAKGSQIFNEITRLPEYYLTQCEIEILEKNKNIISSLLAKEDFNLIELGPGEALKTQILAKQFIQDLVHFNYTPIDISPSAIEKIEVKFKQSLPKIEIQAIAGDYFNGLKWLSTTSKKRNLLLFFGSTIGNFDNTSMRHFLLTLWNILNQGDYLLIGFDLRKDIKTLLKAYNDDDGLTRDFNLNLLSRINDELGANFKLEQFEHYPTYNATTGSLESYLISQIDQTIHIEAINHDFHFDPWEATLVECSHKYFLEDIEQLAKDTGFSIVKTFNDNKNYFVDSLWQVAKN